MTSEGEALRAHLREIGRVKRESAAEDARAHLKLTIGQRLERVVSLSEQCLARHADDTTCDDDAETWARVQVRLRHLARGRSVEA